MLSLNTGRPLWGLSESFSSLTEQAHLSQSFFVGDVFSPLIVFVASSGPSPTAPNLSFSEGPRPGHSPPVEASWGQRRRQSSLLPCRPLLLRGIPGYSCLYRLQVHTSGSCQIFSSTRTCKFFSAGLFSMCSLPHMSGSAPTQFNPPCWTSSDSRWPTSQICPSPFGWHPFLCSISLVSSASLLRMSLILLPISLIKTLKCTSPKAEAWGTASLAYSKPESAWWFQEVAASFSYEHRVPTVGCGHVHSARQCLKRMPTCLLLDEGWRSEMSALPGL